MVMKIEKEKVVREKVDEEKVEQEKVEKDKGIPSQRNDAKHGYTDSLKIIENQEEQRKTKKN